MSFHELLAEAIRYFTVHGYASPDDMENWMRRLRKAAEAQLVPEKDMVKQLERSLKGSFERFLSPTALKRRHPDVARFTVNQIKPQLRDELSRRIVASANLIKLNRDQAIEKTLQRFSGWVTSVPDGGSRVVQARDVKTAISKALRQCSYEERRVAIDQGHKLMASIDAVIADQTAAIAGKWRDHGSVDKTYDARHSHMQRDGKIYAVRGSWAAQKGLINKGAGYLDEMTAPGEEVFCRCYVVYYTNLRDLPDDMLTQKGRDALAEVRAKIRVA